MIKEAKTTKLRMLLVNKYISKLVSIYFEDEEYC